MKLINIVYASIYDWYYKMKSNGRKVDPLGMVALVFGLSIEGWFLLCFYGYYKFFKNNAPIPYSTVAILFVIAVIFTWLVNEYYTSKERYLEIYNNYLSTNNKRSKQEIVFFSFCLLFSPYLILLGIFIF